MEMQAQSTTFLPEVAVELRVSLDQLRMNDIGGAVSPEPQHVLEIQDGAHSRLIRHRPGNAALPLAWLNIHGE